MSATVEAQERASLETGAVGDCYIPSGCIPDVLKGTVRNLRDGCYSFSDILDLAAHHLVYMGEARAVEVQLRGGVMVRQFLRERYGIACGPSERGDRSDRKRFRLWLADAQGISERMDSDQSGALGKVPGFLHRLKRRPAAPRIRELPVVEMVDVPATAIAPQRALTTSDRVSHDGRAVAAAVLEAKRW